MSSASHLTVVLGGDDDRANLRALTRAYLESPPFGVILAWVPEASSAREVLAPEEVAESESLAAQAALWANEVIYA